MAGAPAGLAQDSVALTPGGNDALSAYDAAAQRVRYAVDLSPLTTSWNNPILVGPVAKASRDVDPMFRTQILGSLAVSPTMGQNLSFASRSYARWTTPGQGVSATANAAPGESIALTGLRVHFGLGFSDFSLSPSNAVGCLVGRDAATFTRLYVERVVGASSRAAAAGSDTSTISLGAIDNTGLLAIRADNFNAATSTAGRLLGDNILRVATALRSGAVNTLTASGSTNTAADAAATTYVVSNESTPTNTPSLMSQPGVGPFTLVYDFASRFRSGASGPTFAHLPAGSSGHRGNPSYSTVNYFGGTAGTVASIAMPSPAGVPNRLMAFGLAYGSGGSAPLIAGTPRLFTLPSPVSVPGFTANSAGTAAFNQYLSQTGFRGGNGQVGIGSLSVGGLVLAATATDPTAGPFIAVMSANNVAETWTVAAYPGMPVRSSQNGPSIGALKTTGLALSAPAVDRSGNVYFVASWQPALQPEAVGLFRAVTTTGGYPAGGYQLELMLSTGQSIAGPNSGRTYTVTSLTLSDQNSVASGTLFSGSLLQDLDPKTRPARDTSIRTFGGLAVNAVVTYDNAGTPEAYDAVLFVGPAEGLECPADFNASGTVELTDIFNFLNAWFTGNPLADFNRNGSVELTDIFAFLNAWFSGC
jgi:hypothetical protein